MQLGGLEYSFKGAHCTARMLGARPKPDTRWAWVLLVACWFTPFFVPAHADDLEDLTALPSLPWSALPDTAKNQHPLFLVVPRLPIALGADPSLDQWNDELSTKGVGTTLWSSEYGDARLGFSVGEVESDHPFGEDRKRYTAIVAFDQPLGFSTALTVDVLSKDKRRGLRKFKLFQVALTHPVADTGNVTAGSVLMLNGLKPEVNFGVRLYLPFSGP